MLEDNMYNLISQLVEESQSLWQIKNKYKIDAVGNNEILGFWEKLEKDKEQHVKDLTLLVKKNIK